MVLEIREGGNPPNLAGSLGIEPTSFGILNHFLYFLFSFYSSRCWCVLNDNNRSQNRGDDTGVDLEHRAAEDRAAEHWVAEDRAAEHPAVVEVHRYHPQWGNLNLVAQSLQSLPVPERSELDSGIPVARRPHHQAIQVTGCRGISMAKTHLPGKLIVDSGNLVVQSRLDPATPGEFLQRPQVERADIHSRSHRNTHLVHLQNGLGEGSQGRAQTGGSKDNYCKRWDRTGREENVEDRDGE